MKFKEDDDGAKYLPDPEEIERVCREEIQPTWSSREERKRTRADCKPTPWKLPVVKVDDLPEEVQKMLKSVNKGDEDGDHKTEAVVLR